MRSERFGPPGRPRGGVVVCHEVWGVTGPLLATASALASTGLISTVPDFYARAGSERSSTEDYVEASRWRDSLDASTIGAVLDAELDFLREADVGRIGVLGYSMGGAIALWAAASRKIDAAITFYGGGLVEPYWADMRPGVELVRQLSVKWVGFYGSHDPLTPPSALEELQKGVVSGGDHAMVTVFDGLDHGFALDRNDPRYAPREAALAWHRTVEVFGGDNSATR